MDGIAADEPVQGFVAPVHRALTEPILLGGAPRALIAETIDLIAVLAGRGNGRRLAELARVHGLGPDGDYLLTPAGAP